MYAIAILLLAVAALVLSYLGEIWIATILGIAAVVLLLASFWRVLWKGTKGFARGAKADIKREAEAMEKHEPKAPDIPGALAQVGGALGEKAGEALYSDESTRYTSVKTVERAQKGAKNLIELWKRLFRK